MKRTFLVFCLFVSINCIGQSTSYSLKEVISPSPDVSALIKPINYSVGNYSGLPGISLPLAQIDNSGINLPISLSYNASGIKVSEISSNVGTGWSFNAGGCITRAVNGKPDTYAFLTTQYASYLPYAKKYYESPCTAFEIGNCIPGDESIGSSIASGAVDGGPDIYYFNFGGYQGTFFMDENSSFITTALSAIKIEYFQNVNFSIYDIAQWVLTTPDGFKYYFGLSQTGTQFSAIEKNQVGSALEAITAWQLCEIRSPSGESVYFNYDDYNYSYNTLSGEFVNLANGSVSDYDPIDYSYSGYTRKTVVNTVKSKALKTISGRFGSVQLQNTTRTDISGAPKLAGITISNSQGTLCKKLQLLYDYSIGGRLTLNKVQEISTASNLVAIDLYTIDYNLSETLPSHDPAYAGYNSQDLWGYYNGVANSRLIQSEYVSVFGTQLNLKLFTGADRHADETKMKAGIISQIRYASGGVTKFDFEANKFYGNNYQNGVLPAPISNSFNVTCGNNETKYQDFTINTSVNERTPVTFNAHSLVTAGCTIDPQSGVSFCYNAYVVGVNGTSYGPVILKDGASVLNLLPGQYRAYLQGLSAPSNTFYLTLNWRQYNDAPVTTGNQTVGGLRLLRLTNIDANGNTSGVKKYLYNLFSNTTQSSGIVNYTPQAYYVSYSNLDNNCFSTSVFTQIVEIPSNRSSLIGYKNITELDGENGENGKTEYTYTTSSEFRDQGCIGRPFPPLTSYEYRRGLLLDKKTYKNTGGSFMLIRSETNNYVNTPTQLHLGYGLAADQSAFGGCVNSNNYFMGSYRLSSEFIYLKSTNVKDFNSSNDGAYLEKISNFDYDTLNKHYQLIKTVTTDSKNLSVQNSLKYPQDITLTGNAELARQSLVTKHIWNPVLQQTTLNNAVQTSQVNNFYLTFGNGYTQPESIEGKMGSASAEKRIEFLKYDQAGNLLQQHKVRDNINIFIWDYKNLHPVAQVLTTNDTNIDSVAYTSFEADGKGNWTFSGTPIVDASAPTGRKCYVLGSSITKSGLSTSLTYIVSYWKKSGTVSVNGTSATSGRTVRGWTYYEHKVVPASGLITISGTVGIIDELRLYPVKASMVTYTYKPLVGLTSQCDANSRITYYEYDDFNRLLLVRDQDYNIVKRNSYSYTGQTENTTLVYNSQQQGTFIGVCTGCMVGASLNYIVPQGVYLAPSLTEANQLALADVTANGQDYANAMTACTAPGNASLIGSNSNAVSFTVQFTNTNASCSPASYSFTINAGASNFSLGTIKEGKYNVTFSAGTNPSGYTYRVNGLTIHSVGGTIYNVNISTSASNQVVITP